ncbi:MAG: polysaccharide pyruvyl transferase family protein [Verrucomicrobiales bacterium]|nr:polysaccharide pyruvyl transferase family protein [Verrucomicrobiales bacterium]
MSKKPLIELLGVWLPNKGAELMLHTVRQELDKRLQDASFAIQSNEPFQSESRFKKLQKCVPSSNSLLDKIFRTTSQDQGMVTDSQITHYIDISGFAYGDPWGVKKARKRLGKKVKKLNREGKPYYLLPQAFGPFTDPKLQREMQLIGSNASLLCARDSVSLAHLKGLGLESAEQYPDITFALDAKNRTVPDIKHSPYGCLIVNNKLVSSSTMQKNDLLDLFTASGKHMQRHGISPQVLLHEPKEDKDLADELAQALDCPIIELEDARDIKNCIKHSYVTVTARFHGLVSALSTGTPAMAVGWSHKYKELLTDFDARHFVFNDSPKEFLGHLEDLLSSAENHQKISDQFQITAHKQTQKLSVLFDQLAEHINETI